MPSPSMRPLHNLWWWGRGSSCCRRSAEAEGSRSMSGGWRSIDLDSTPEAICSYAKVFRRVRVLLSIPIPRRGWSRACPPPATLYVAPQNHCPSFLRRQTECAPSRNPSPFHSSPPDLSPREDWLRHLMSGVTELPPVIPAEAGMWIHISSATRFPKRSLPESCSPGTCAGYCCRPESSA